ncbi:gas vesicle protein GvpO [Haloplanus natans]|jgi:hypothetical protein|uniref:gas vesicle protein GvpO n=1 Tax=Haloplanus natans TaxID=376171 RepID=UPI0006776C09
MTEQPSDAGNPTDAKGDQPAERVGEARDGDEAPESTPPTGHDDTAADTPSTFGISDAQQRAREAAAELLEHEFEGIIKVEPDDNRWRTVVEVVERRAVPDTQDIIGRYQISLDNDGGVTGYELLARYKRSDMKEEF